MIAVVALVVGLVLAAFANLLYGAVSGDPLVWGIASASSCVFYLLLYVFGDDRPASPSARCS